MYVLLATSLAFALQASQPAPAGNQTAKPTIAVVGDSISFSHITTPGPCGMNTATKCTYVRDKTQAYPAEIAATTGFAVSNYALGGTETTVTAPSGRPPIIDQVASVDPLTTIVIFEGGTNDTAFGSTDYTRIDEVTAAIRARAPKAKIVFVGVRYYWSSQADKVDAWDAHERSVAASVGGAFVDTRIWPPSDYADFPDGTHPSVTGVHKLATAVVEALKALQLPSYGASDQR